jgi:hypothetical protein
MKSPSLRTFGFYIRASKQKQSMQLKHCKPAYLCSVNSFKCVIWSIVGTQIEHPELAYSMGA